MIENEILQFIQNNFDFEAMSLSSSYYYDHLPFGIIDAVYSIGAKYESTKRTVATYAERKNLKLYRQYQTTIECASDSHTVSMLLCDLSNNDYDYAARDLFCNRQRTSTRNGILKAEAVYRFAKVLNDFSVDRFKDIHLVKNNLEFELRIKEIPGQRSGISLAYFFMLTGDETLIKPDRHILRFIESVTGKIVNQDEAQEIFSKVTTQLKKHHSKLTVRNLDHMIWRYSSNK